MLRLPAQRDPGAAPGERLPLGLAGVRGRARSSAPRRRGRRPSGSSSPGRPSSRRSPRPGAGGRRRRRSAPIVSIISFSGRTTAWQRSPASNPSVSASILGPLSSCTTPLPTTVAGIRLETPMKPATKVVVRPLVDLDGRADLLDPAVVHHRDPVAHRQRLLLVVGDVDEGDADLALDPLQLELQALAQLQVEGAERLVEEQHLRQVDQRPGERDPLLLAAGELRGAAVRLGARGRPARARPRPGPRSRPSAPSCASARRRRCRRRSGGGRGRSSGRRCWSAAGGGAGRRRRRRRSGSSPRSAARSRRSSAGSSSCRSRSARAG